ncbi:C-C motif chemokine 26 [Hippopotamus amphibius kiboko]|uniref:C-C motif chemokine 26 n=1 Tax=Hippopotamus amphibius kiboko TaxID=575201 RepID=UPI002595A68B|nr:C-C motif chemokine 26 [Hippopotamus amphibius kiboko]
MKSFPTASTLFLVFILCVHLGAAIRGSDVAKFCCFQYSRKILPWKRVSNYELTRNSCSQQAVIFTTKRGQKICAKLNEPWVQKYISLLKTQQQH